MEQQPGVRSANAARVLRHLHLDGPLSRAALTELTGLNRSTIADLIGALTSSGLVCEGAPDPSYRAGRPSPVVHLDSSVLSIAVHPEVDALTIAAIGLDRGIPARIRLPLKTLITPSDVADFVAAQLEKWRSKELNGARVAAIGVAVPGLVRASDGVVRDAPHLLWRDEAIGALLTDATGLPVAVGNDATLGAVAEHLFGAARGHDDIVYLNGGASGIGGGIIVHGGPVGGSGGYAGEFGQNLPAMSDPVDRNSEGGRLEDEVRLDLLSSALGLGSDVDDATLAQAIRSARSPSAIAEISRQRRILSIAVAGSANILDPSSIVLGGFLAALVEADLDGFTAAVHGATMPTIAENLEIRLAMLADERLLIGAAEAAFAELLRDPLSLR